MEAFLRCNICNGSKNVMPLGGMPKKCLACDGTGFEAVTKNKVTIIETNANINHGIDDCMKKRGRPKSNS